MSDTCNHNCSSCGENCSSRTAPQSFKLDANKNARVKNVIGVVSGKGGVGKSLVTSLLAQSMSRAGKKTAIIDADITGPSIPRIFGVNELAGEMDGDVIPVETKNGIKLISINLLLDEATKPVIWRGPIIANVVRQFWTEVAWGDVDYMFVDMPPGTGDVPLTVFQSLPVDGIIIVSSPQDLVEMIVEKAVRMAEEMKVPVLGMVQNMAYFECPDCHKRHKIFGDSDIKGLAEKYGVPFTAEIPILPEIAKVCDEGKMEETEYSWLDDIIKAISNEDEV